MELLVVLLAFLIFVVPIWALVRTFLLKQRSATREETEGLRKRMDALEGKVESLRRAVEKLAAGAPVPAPAPAQKTEPRAAPPPPQATAPPPAVQTKPVAEKPPAPAAPAAPPSPPLAPPAAKTEIPPATPVPPQQPVAPPITQVPPPRPVVPEPATSVRIEAPVAKAPLTTPSPAPPSGAAPKEPPRPAVPAPSLRTPPATHRQQWGEIEERVGMKWLGRIGITVLVIGLGLLLNLWVPTLGKGGKVAVAYALSGVLLGLGVWGERSERYRNLARAVLGGGWAATYATTYALHSVPVMRVVESAAVGFLLLFVVAAGIVLHSLRYDSELVTGFAYTLGYVTIVLGEMTLGTMAASALLSASLVVVLWKKRWHWLETVGIAATYLVHWMWLRQVFSGLLDKKQFTEFVASAALLTLYWAVFTVSHYLRSEREHDERVWLVVAFLMNAAGYLAVMRYQSIYPELRFWFLLGAGVTYVVIAAFSRWAGRRLGFLLGSTLGSALILAAIPYRYSGARLEFIWLLETEALLFIGWRLAEPHLRKLAWAAGGVLAPYIIYHDLAPRFQHGESTDVKLGWLVLALGLAYFANARFVARFLRDDATETDSLGAQLSAPVGAMLLLAAAWVAFPILWVAVAWAALALALREYGRWMDDAILQVCGHGVAAMVLARLVAVNLQHEPAGVAPRFDIWTIAAAAGLLTVTAWRMRQAEPKPAGRELLPEFFGKGAAAIYAWAATVPVALLIVNESAARPRELTWAVLGLAALAALVSFPILTGYLMTAAWLALPFMWAALVWVALAVMLSEIGVRRSHRVLRVCGHIAALLAAVRLLFVNMQYAPESAGLGANLRVWTVALGVAGYYLFARRISPAKSEPDEEVPLMGDVVWRGNLAAIYTTLGSLLAGLLIWNEVTRAGVALAWGMLGLALFEAGRALADRPLRVQGYVLLALSFGRIFIADLNMASAVGPVSARLVTVTLLAAIYYYCGFTAVKEMGRARDVFFWFGTVALAALGRFELPEPWVAIGWAALTVALFFLGRTLKQDAFAYQAHLLAALVAIRCALDDFYQEDTRTTTVVVASLLLYTLLAVTLREKNRRAQTGGDSDGTSWVQRLDRNSQHLYFFIPTLLLTVLLFLEVRRSYLTAAWGAEGVVVFIVALRMGERAFRLFSLGLLLLCVGRVVLVDVWAFDPMGRIISFMALGAALLLVSYLYTRYRETWKKYL